MKKGILIICAALLLATLGCYNDKYDQLYVPSATPVVCDTTSVSFATDIQPILNQYCTTCHSSTGVAAGYGDYTTYGKSLTAQANNGNMVTDINTTDISSVHHMPQNSPSLSACDINKITAWINQGTKNN